jgi:DNA polymerase III subunit gamma/tau
MAWFRTYRPQRVADLHLTVVREQLQSILDSGKYSQAYLFAGPKGTGKTSTARILARILNDPTNEAVVLGASGKLLESTTDSVLLRQIAQGNSTMIIEQDAASHRGIDDVRQLQETIGIAPSDGLIRVVILDEVHMFSNDAFNALLKVLEEPPSRVVFILATTELHKVPATIQSRTQIIRFQQATPDEIAQALQGIAAKEGFTLEPAVAQSIAQAGRGSFRDAVKYLEQSVKNGVLDEAQLHRVLGATAGVDELLRALAQKDSLAVSTFFTSARQKGESMNFLEIALVEQAQQRLHRAISRKESLATVQKILALLEHLTARLGGLEPVEGLRFELACLSWCYDGQKPKNDQNESQGGSKDELACDREDEIVVAATPQQVRQGEVVPAPVVKNVSRLSWESIRAEWPAFLLALRLRSQALESLIRNGRLDSFENNRIRLTLGMPFHKEQLESGKYLEPLRSALEEIFGPEVTIGYQIELDAQLLEVQVEDRGQSDNQLLQAVEEAVLSLGA